MKLTMDEKESLAGMMQSLGWEAFEKLMLEAYKKQEYAVMAYNLADGPEKLVHAKARAEGAKQFMEAILAYKRGLIKELR